MEKRVTVRNKLGLGALQCAIIQKTMVRFRSDVFISKDGMLVNARSHMSLMNLNASIGSTLTIYVNGEDEEKAMKAIVDAIETKIPWFEDAGELLTKEYLRRI